MLTEVNALLRVFLVSILALDAFLLRPEIHDLYERHTDLTSSQLQHGVKLLVIESSSTVVIALINLIAIQINHYLLNHQFFSMLILIALAVIVFVLHWFVFGEASNKISDLYHVNSVSLALVITENQ